MLHNFCGILCRSALFWCCMYVVSPSVPLECQASSQVKSPTSPQAKPSSSSESLPGWGSEPRRLFSPPDAFLYLESPSFPPLPFPLLSYPCPFKSCGCKLPQSPLRLQDAVLFLEDAEDPPPLICALLIGSSTYSLPVLFSAICVSWLNAGNAVLWSPLACSLNLLVFPWWWCTLICFLIFTPAVVL